MKNERFPVRNVRLPRRQLLQTSAITLPSMAIPGALTGMAGVAMTGVARAADTPPTYRPLNRFPRMVHEYFVDQVRRAERRSLRNQDQLQTASDAKKYIETVQKKIRHCFGPEPQRTPLNPRITGTIDRDQYTIEKVIFESRPGFPVTANLYLPKGRDFPLPGVVGTCGHSGHGKAYTEYQAFAQGLARMGYVCLIYDPIGQGERSQYVDDDLKLEVQGTVHEHLQAGNQQFLVGEFFGAWRAWDGIRALDYLLTRKEVNPQQIGVTGNSGGGTMTTWLCGVESRWTMAAPCCFVTTFRRNLENEMPADTEQCPPKALALGLDHSDFLAVMAPKPVILLTKERDFFDIRGSEEAYQRLQKIYRLLGKEDQIALFTGPTGHGISQENREALYRWFNGVTQVSDAQTEPELTIEDDETLWCTPKGQVAGMGAKSVFNFTDEHSRRLGEQRGTVTGKPLIDAVRQTLKLRPAPSETLASEAPDFRILNGWRSRGYPSESGATYAVETERDVFALVSMLTKDHWQSRPPKIGKHATLYVSHRSSDVELRDEPLIREIIKDTPEVPFFACDVRGIGESQPDTCGKGSFEFAYGSDYFYAIHSVMLDRPYVGQKTTDVLRVIDWLASYGYTDIHLVGKGWGALPATFAALLSDQVTKVTLKNALTSYADIAQSEHYHWPLATLLPNVLKRFDLPDCYRELQTKHLRQIDPWDAEAGG